MRATRLAFASILATLLVCTSAFAHLCNDVFVQAKDNLAVKVDVRDGQLRIGQEGSFRVYLLNTMDRDIVDIHLAIKSDEFEAQVTPSTDWKRFPHLRTTKRGGEKVYFEVRLRRKAGVPDGTYSIGLHLYNGRNKSMVFKTVDLNSAAALHRLEPADGIACDGHATREEWGEADLATGFYEYVKQGRYFENRAAEAQARFRVAADRQNLYFLLSFAGHDGAERDVGTILLAENSDAEPVRIDVDRTSGELRASRHQQRIEARKVNDRMVEVKVPLDALGQVPQRLFINYLRTVRDNGREIVTYWRGNKFSAENPIVYDQYVLNL